MVSSYARFVRSWCPWVAVLSVSACMPPRHGREGSLSSETAQTETAQAETSTTSPDVGPDVDDGPLVWRTVPSPTSGHLYGVWAGSPTDAWAVGGDEDEALFLHWDGVAWRLVPGPANAAHGAERQLAVWGSGARDVWSADANGISHWDGAAWSVAHDAGRGMLRYMGGISGASADDVWVAGGPGDYTWRSTLLHWDGSVWEDLTEKFPEGHASGEASGVAVDPDGVAFIAVDGAELRRWEDDAWSEEPIVSGAHRPLGVLWARGAGEVWSAIGAWGNVQDAGMLARASGGVWSTVSVPGAERAVLRAVWGSGPEALFAVGGDVVAHGNGQGWRVDARAPDGVDMHGVGGSSAEDVWAVGSDGTIMHYGR